MQLAVRIHLYSIAASHVMSDILVYEITSHYDWVVMQCTSRSAVPTKSLGRQQVHTYQTARERAREREREREREEERISVISQVNRIANNTYK